VRDAETAVKLCEQAKGDQILLGSGGANGEVDGTRLLERGQHKQDAKEKAEGFCCFHRRTIFSLQGL
jgi:hypothetical protein